TKPTKADPCEAKNIWRKADNTGRRLAVAAVLSMLAAGDSAERILQGYRWLEKEEVNACLVFARRVEGTNDLELDRETNTRTGN
ncbi:MAG: DUF433 domain-containing protein, partial [Nitrospirales bacterium]